MGEATQYSYFTKQLDEFISGVFQTDNKFSCKALLTPTRDLSISRDP